MTTPAEDFAPLGHMLEAPGWALSIAEGRALRDLDLDLQLFLVLSRAIEVVGEAANRSQMIRRAERRRYPGDELLV